MKKLFAFFDSTNFHSSSAEMMYHMNIMRLHIALGFHMHQLSFKKYVLIRVQAWFYYGKFYFVCYH